MIYLFTGFFLLYISWVAAMIVVWSSKKKPPENCGPNKVSVLIPVRNEAFGIKPLLEDLEQQTLPFENYEVVVIDDHSNDATESVVNLYIHKSPLDLRYLPLSKEQFGKKAAITLGVQEAKGHIVLCTDGDCRVHSEWIATMARYFTVENQLVAGPVAYQPGDTVLGEVLRTEFLTLIGVGAASIFFGYPNMVNGANLAYRKSAFMEVNGFEGNEHILTGDDEFLIQKIRDRFPNSIKYALNRHGLVLTCGPKNIAQFLSQRKRWASKWKYHPLRVKLMALFIFVFYALYISVFSISLTRPSMLILFLGIFASKLSLDGYFVFTVARQMKQPVNWFSIFFLELLYPLYAVFFGIYSNFGCYKWKGRQSNI